MFCDALATDETNIVALRPAVCVEIGYYCPSLALFDLTAIISCGSGCIITFLGQLLKRHELQSHLLATDVNRNALLATQATARHNNVHYPSLHRPH